MPMLVGGLGRLNQRFDTEHIQATAKEANDFAPERGFDAGKLIGKDDVAKAFQRYLNHLPGGVKETLRAVVYYSLKLKPPKPINFGWAPAYDSELTIWESDCGITLLVKSRYPTDRLSEGARGKD